MEQNLLPLQTKILLGIAFALYLMFIFRKQKSVNLFSLIIVLVMIALTYLMPSASYAKNILILIVELIFFLTIVVVQLEYGGKNRRRIST